MAVVPVRVAGSAAAAGWPERGVIRTLLLGCQQSSDLLLFTTARVLHVSFACSSQSQYLFSKC